MLVCSGIDFIVNVILRSKSCTTYYHKAHVFNIKCHAHIKQNTFKLQNCVLGMHTALYCSIC